MAVDSIVIGQKDNVGDIVTKIFLKNADFVVYVAAGKPKLLSCREGGISGDYSNIIASLTRLRAETSDFSKPYERFVDVTAASLLRGVSGDVVAAGKELEELIGRVGRIKSLMARGKYWLVMAVPCLVALCVFIFSGGWHGGEGEAGLDALFPLKCILFGMLGGLISATAQLHKTDIDVEAPWWWVFVFSASRTVLAALSGFASFFVLGSGLVGMVQPPTSAGGYYAVAMLAGFSEHYVPNMLIKISKK